MRDRKQALIINVSSYFYAKVTLKISIPSLYRKQEGGPDDFV